MPHSFTKILLAVTTLERGRSDLCWKLKRNKCSFFSAQSSWLLVQSLGTKTNVYTTGRFHKAWKVSAHGNDSPQLVFSRCACWTYVIFRSNQAFGTRCATYPAKRSTHLRIYRRKGDDWATHSETAFFSKCVIDLRLIFRHHLRNWLFRFASPRLKVKNAILLGVMNCRLSRCVKSLKTLVEMHEKPSKSSDRFDRSSRAV